MTVKESSKVDEAALKVTGARGVIIRGNGVQVIYGPHVTIIKNEVEEIFIVMKTVLDSLKGKLIVSCQALENEPLHSPFIMSRMALAAAQGGAAGIRANSVADISAIKEIVSLPMIGIIKRDYPGSEVFITATLREVDELMTVEPEIIALDATARPRLVVRRWKNWSRRSALATRPYF